MKHTPGPWKIQKSEWANAPAIIRDIDDIEIAEVHIDESPNRPSLLANASLIAAAPEMYDWLIKEYSTCAPLSTKGRELAKLVAKAEGRSC